MKSTSILRYIFFGTALRYLQDVRVGQRARGTDYVEHNVNQLLEMLAEFELPVTIRAAYRLYETLAKLSTFDEDHTLTADEAKEIQEIAEQLRPTLFAEAEGNVAYIVTDKRVDINKLLSDVGGLFAPDVYSSLPEVAQHDFKEAGRCIAFELPTAGAFHLLRGTEDVLRSFYRSVVKRNRVELMWGPMVKSLRERSRNAPSKTLLNNLDNIRLSFRNPTQHPDKIYDIQEVQDLMGLCVDVVNRMATP